jgi:hypothetical protein
MSALACLSAGLVCCDAEIEREGRTCSSGDREAARRLLYLRWLRKVVVKHATDLLRRALGHAACSDCGDAGSKGEIALAQLRAIASAPAPAIARLLRSSSFAPSAAAAAAGSSFAGDGDSKAARQRSLVLVRAATLRVLAAIRVDERTKWASAGAAFDTEAAAHLPYAAIIARAQKSGGVELTIRAAPHATMSTTAASVAAFYLTASGALASSCYSVPPPAASDPRRSAASLTWRAISASSAGSIEAAGSTGAALQRVIFAVNIRALECAVGAATVRSNGARVDRVALWVRLSGSPYQCSEGAALAAAP